MAINDIQQAIVAFLLLRNTKDAEISLFYGKSSLSGYYNTIYEIDLNELSEFILIYINNKNEQGKKNSD